VAGHQVQWSLLDSRPAGGMVELCSAHDVQLLVYGALAGGFLSSRFLDRAEPVPPLANRSLVKYRLIIDEFGGWDLFQDLLRVASEIAYRHGVDVSNVAMRYALERPQVAAVIVGAAGSRHLPSTLRTLTLRLGDEDRAALQAVLDRAAGPAGDVYGLERHAGGPHASIMKYDLHRQQDDAV
jgi:aryl-alcohol dehydrogenase-like predicted oxidoreductase